MSFVNLLMRMNQRVIPNILRRRVRSGSIMVIVMTKLGGWGPALNVVQQMPMKVPLVIIEFVCICFALEPGLLMMSQGPTS